MREVFDMGIVNLRSKVFKLSLILAIIGVVFLVLSYFCFHYVTDEGITTVWHPEAGKPFVTLYIGVFGVFMLAEASILALSGLVLFNKEEKANEAD